MTGPAYSSGGPSKDPSPWVEWPIVGGLGYLAYAAFRDGHVLIGLVFALLAFMSWLMLDPRVRSWAPDTDTKPRSAAGQTVTIAELHERSRRAGGGSYLATGQDGRWLAAPAESAVLVLAGPRAGKTSCVVIPALAAHPGPAVATSTKPEVLSATLGARQALGHAWFFDLQGRGAPPGTRPLRWSPVTLAGDWHQAQLTAEAMTGASELNADAESAHWTERAAALISALLHAAALSGQGIESVQAWVLRHDTDSPLAELEPDTIAHDVLSGIARTSDRERSAIFSTAARVLRAYRSPVALNASTHADFDAERFVSSTDTIYIAAGAQEQRLLAPLVVGLLTEIRQAAYRQAARSGPPSVPLQFMLDECANIAPLPDLPPMLSEAGGQGVQNIVVLQDMSQARRRWPKDADGMLSLFGARIILSGVADPATLNQLSLLCGEWDRPVQTTSNKRAGGLSSFLLQQRPQTGSTESWTTRRERRLPASEIAQLPRGQALVMIGARWEILPTLPHHQHPTFAQLTNLREPPPNQ